MGLESEQIIIHLNMVIIKIELNIHGVRMHATMGEGNGDFGDDDTSYKS